MTVIFTKQSSEQLFSVFVCVSINRTPAGLFILILLSVSFNTRCVELELHTVNS